MKLLIDIGNARIKWAILDGATFGAINAIRHWGRTGDALVEFESLLPDRLEGARAVNVAGARVAAELRSLLRRRCGIDTEFVLTTAEDHGLQCAYSDPSKFGADRWVAMIGARAVTGERGVPVCVVDAGTAVTFDAIDSIGQHLGGLILPGPAMMSKMLDAATSGIGATAVAAAVPEGLDVLGNDTAKSVGHAAWLAIAAGLDRAIGLVAAELGGAPIVFVTGGDSAVLARWMQTDVERRSDLVLEGLAYIENSR